MYTLDTFACELSFLRLYTLFPRYLLNHYPEDWSPNNERTVRVCKMNGSEAGVLFALKAYLTLRPYHVLSLLLLTAFVCFGFAIRTFEIVLVDPCNRFFYISNAFWLVVQTMTLVGYGDVVPLTHFGRLICVFACLAGVITLSLFVSALSTTTEFTPVESKVYEAISIENASREELRNEAGCVVKDFLTMIRLKKR